jgi:valyl-tRNA synthetase
LKGKKAIVPICGRVIPIIEDEYVDIEFGTGCLKVTPAHDMNDKALGEKHNLEIIDIFNEDATLTVLDCTFKVKIVLWFVKRQRIRNHWCFGKTETL